MAPADDRTESTGAKMSGSEEEQSEWGCKRGAVGRAECVEARHSGTECGRGDRRKGQPEVRQRKQVKQPRGEECRCLPKSGTKWGKAGRGKDR